jgi:hypothetical protein
MIRYIHVNISMRKNVVVVAIMIPVRKKSNLNEFFDIAGFGSIHKTVKIQ